MITLVGMTRFIALKRPDAARVHARTGTKRLAALLEIGCMLWTGNFVLTRVPSTYLTSFVIESKNAT